MNTVEQIHNEIDTAQDRILKEALAIIEKHKDTSNFDKANRLKALGFTGCDVVLDSEEVRAEIDRGIAQAGLVRRYAHNYPFLKYLTEAELDRICKKYNLVYAPVSAYKKEVPDKNLIEIEQAQPLNADDVPLGTYRFKLDYYSYVPREVREFFKTFQHTSSDVNDNRLRALCPIKYKGEYLYKAHGCTAILMNKSGLFIAAPKSHFDLTKLKGVKGTSGFFSLSSFKVEPKDPIVFRYVRGGGVQILSKWGDEAEDESLVVPKLN